MINFEYSSFIRKWFKYFSFKSPPLTFNKDFLFRKFPSHLFFLLLYRYIRFVIVSVIYVFVLPKMSPGGTESTWEKYGNFWIHSILISNNSYKDLIDQL